MYSSVVYSENRSQVYNHTLKRCKICLKWPIIDNVYNQLTRLKIFSRNSLFTRHNRSVVGRNLYEAGQKEHQVTIPAKSSSTEWNTIIHHCDHKPIGQRNIESPKRDLRIPTLVTLLPRTLIGEVGLTFISGFLHLHILAWLISVLNIVVSCRIFTDFNTKLSNVWKIHTLHKYVNKWN